MGDLVAIPTYWRLDRMDLLENNWEIIGREGIIGTHLPVSSVAALRFSLIFTLAFPRFFVKLNMGTGSFLPFRKES
jgi:hypothetical protein